jgi:hypothetical protein
VYARAEDERGTEPGDQQVTCRELAMLRAVAAGRAELIRSCEPDLYIDGLCCCDQYTAHQLARRGLLRATAPGRIGERVRAELTATGHAFFTGIPFST